MLGQQELGVSYLSLKWTTLAGISNWLFDASPSLLAFRCDCTDHPLLPLYNVTHKNSIESVVEFVPSSGHSQDSSTLRGPGCSPRVLAQGRLRYIIDNGRINPDAEPSPAIQDIVLAQFNMIVDTLKNEGAIVILESIPVNGSFFANVTAADDELGKRVVKAAVLPSTAVSNMRGFLTIRQYGLYQALVRGDHDCPVPETNCGIDGPDRCDQYPPRT